MQYRSSQQRIGVVFGTILILALAVGALSTGGVLGKPGGKVPGCGYGYGYGYGYGGYGYGYDSHPKPPHPPKPGHPPKPPKPPHPGGYGYGYGYGYGGYGYEPGCPGTGYGHNGNGRADCEEPSQGGCANPAPIYGSYDPRRRTPTFVAAQNVDALVVAHPGIFSFPAVIGLDQQPPAIGPPPNSGGSKFSVLSDHFKVSVRDTSRNTYEFGGEWDPPLEILVYVPAFAADFPDSELAPHHIAVGSTTWKPIPSIGNRTTLGLNEDDGFYISGSGNTRIVHVLTRHLTTFALFRKAAVGGGTTNPDPKPDPKPDKDPPADGGNGNGNGGSNDNGTPPGGGSGNGAPAPRPTTPSGSNENPATLKVAAKLAKKQAVKNNSFAVTCNGTGPAKKCAVTATAKVGRRTVTIGSGSAAFKSGSAKVTVKLNAAGKKALKKAGKRGLAVTVKLTATGNAGTRATATAKVTLTPAKKSKRR